MVFRKKRDDAKMGNVSGIPYDVMDKYREDIHLGTVLKKEHVSSLSQLKKKYSSKNNC